MSGRSNFAWKNSRAARAHVPVDPFARFWTISYVFSRLWRTDHSSGENELIAAIFEYKNT
jgi:hypothetical protein